MSGRSAEGRPPYRVPTMAEIRAMPKSGLRAVSTFTGAGGSCLGMRMAGFEVLWASEFVEAARDTYATNFPDTPIDARDIRAVEPREILAAVDLAEGELDLMDGSPPCASFSMAGKREQAWGEVRKYSDTEQRVDDLFFEFARILAGVRPRAFIAENVKGLITGKAKGYFKDILAALKGCGYVVEAKVLDAQWLGVPQTRQRVIFVGMRADLGLAPVHPKPLRYRYSIKDALPWIGRVVHDTSGLYGQGNVTDRPSSVITIGVNSVNSNHFKVETVGGYDDLRIVGGKTGFRAGKVLPSDEPAPAVMAAGIEGVGPHQLEIERAGWVDGPSIAGFAIGAEYDRLRPGEQSDRYFNLVRPREDLPSPTVTQMGGIAGAASVVHPTEKRKFTIAELKRICAFPDDFVLTGTYRQQWERLGRAVPPIMMMHVAAAIRDRLTGVG